MRREKRSNVSAIVKASLMSLRVVRDASKRVILVSTHTFQLTPSFVLLFFNNHSHCDPSRIVILVRCRCCSRPQALQRRWPIQIGHDSVACDDLLVVRRAAKNLFYQMGVHACTVCDPAAFATQSQTRTTTIWPSGVRSAPASINAVRYALHVTNVSRRPFFFFWG